MNVNPNHPVNRIEPLPADFDSEAQQVDALLSAQARRTAVPMGLTDRVFEASVKSLPRSRQPALRLAGSAADVQRRHVLFTLHRTAWGRAAMAASVAIVCGVAWLMLQSSPAPSPDGSLLAIHTAGPDANSLAASGDMLPVGSLDQLDNDMGYLLNTDTLTSMDEVHQELAMLVASLEM